MTVCKKCEFEQKGMMAGQAFREFTCTICGSTGIWYNTNVPKICGKCSEKLNICQRCGTILEKKEEQT